jgi:hypothetical protein
MMTETLCNYPDRDEHLVAFLYDDIDSAERTSFGSHLSACRYCQEDLSALRGVRSTLSTWAPPEPARVFASPEPRVPSPEPRAWWHDMPAWAQVAAALFVLGVSMTIANLDVRYDRAGLTIRTGWSTPQASAPAPVNAAPWRAELTALENQLRSEMKASQAAVTAASVPAAQAAMSDADFRRSVRVLLDESEKRQQKELALRLIEFQRDSNAQRQADLMQFSQNVGYIQAETRGELLKQRNYILKVSQSR